MTVKEPAWPSAGTPKLALALVALTSLTAAFAGLPLAWDGSYFLFRVLNEQSPLLTNVHNRLLLGILTFPVFLASQLTENFGILRFVFSLSYAAVPFVALACCWIVVRRRPDLFVWPTLGICVALLPGSVLFVSEALIVAELSWPLLLAALVPGQPRSGVVICIVLGVVVAVSHPVALPLLLAVAVVGAVVRRRSWRAAVLWAISFTGLAALNVVELTSRLTSFERESLEPSTAAIGLARGIVGLPIAALLLVTLTAFLIYRGARSTPEARRIELQNLALVTLLFVALTLLIWAAVPAFWRGEIDFRGWAIPLTLPLFALAWLDARVARASDVALAGRRMRLAWAAAAVMFLVIAIQGVVWMQLVTRVSSAQAGGNGCTVAESIEGFPDSALGHWAITPLSILLQARDVRAFVAPGALCEASDWPRQVPMGPVPALTPGWFRFQ